MSATPDDDFQRVAPLLRARAEQMSAKLDAIKQTHGERIADLTKLLFGLTQLNMLLTMMGNDTEQVMPLVASVGSISFKLAATTDEEMTRAKELVRDLQDLAIVATHRPDSTH